MMYGSILKIGKAANALETIEKPNVYSVAYETTLKGASYSGVFRARHF